ncbi:TonB-dependent receptor [Pontibaca methylaminivorans]|uniref:Iron complex outermembrane recepter protein n=1 Tax=Pontibaca methylaminivorans TaxID=515897 RepID=A0A1R3WDN9_9RHOB|nr:TonB-dependent siderophore receptor [Pontibaca methylaminivorans]SIT75497.1 iron complex outermembrane recepter protein [Pontibaca methylaminivorans]
MPELISQSTALSGVSGLVPSIPRLPARPRRRRALVVAALLAGTAAPLSAQDATRSSEDNGETLLLDTITIEGQGAADLDLHQGSTAGSRLGLSSFETPASVQVIDGGAIRSRGERDVTRAIVNTGIGVSFGGSPGNGGTSVSMRGFNGHGSVTRLYDGTRLYPASGTITFPFDTWSVDRIEVLNGPAGVLYGEGGVGGAINVIPKKPLTEGRRDELRATIGTHGQRGLAYGSAGPLGDRLAYSFDANITGSDGWMDRDNMSSRSLSAALRWQATETLALTLSHDFGDNRPSRYFGTPLVDGQVDRRVRYRNYNVEDSLVRYKDRFTQLKAEWTPNDSVTLTSSTYHLTSNRDWRNVESYTYGPGTGVVTRQPRLALAHDVEETGNRTDITIESTFGNIENTATFGFDVNRMKYVRLRHTPATDETTVDFLNPRPGVFGPYTMNIINDSKMNQYSLFMDDRIKFNDQWALVGGLRYDNVDIKSREPAYTKKFSSTSWRIGAVWNPVPDVAVYAQYSRATEPIGSALSLSESQADLKLTRARQQEIGVKFGFLEGRGDATLAAYRIVKTDLLARDPDDPDVTHQIGRQSAKGIEAAIGLEVSPTFRVNANAAFVSSRFDDYVQPGGDYSGNRAANVPHRVANIWGSWDFAANWTARAGAHYVSEAFTSDANTSRRPSYTVVNAGLQWRPQDNISVDLNIENVANRLYATSGRDTQWLLGPPRMATLDVNIRF